MLLVHLRNCTAAQGMLHDGVHLAVARRHRHNPAGTVLTLAALRMACASLSLERDLSRARPLVAETRIDGSVIPQFF